MHCPNCGKQASNEQKFCRSCGMSLETVSQAVARHQSEIDSTKPCVRNESQALRRMGILLFSGLVVLFLGALIYRISKRLVDNDLVHLIGLVTVIAGIILSAYAVISPMWQQAPGRSTKPKPATGTESPARTMPDGLPEAPASITEQTTSRLESEAETISRGGSRWQTG